MNGNNTSNFTLKEKIIIEKNHQKVFKWKVILLVVISNVLVFALCKMDTGTKEKQVLQNIYQKHRGFKTVIISAEKFIASEDLNKNNLVTLINDKNKIIFRDVYFIEQLSDKVKIEIAENELNQLRFINNEHLNLIPHLAIVPTSTNKTLGNQYEIIF
jgi:hypothetical protein